MKTTISFEELNRLMISAKAEIKQLEAEGKDTFREIRALESIRAAKRVVSMELSELLDDHSDSHSWKGVAIMIVNNGGLHEAIMFIRGQIHSLNFIRVRDTGSVAISRWASLTAYKPYATPEEFLADSGRKDVTLIGTIEI